MTKIRTLRAAVLLVLLGGWAGSPAVFAAPGTSPWPGNAPLPRISADRARAANDPAARLQNGVTVERVVNDVLGATDEFGRVQLGRLTLDPGASLPDSILIGPLAGMVESGPLEVQIENAPAQTLAGGDLLTLQDREVAQVRNAGDQTGALLALLLAPRNPSTWGVPLETAMPPGTSFQFVFKNQFVRYLLAPVRLTIDRVILAPGATLDSIDLGGSTDAIGSGIFVEQGSVQLVAAPDESVLSAGDEEWISSTSGAWSTGLTAASDSPAVVVIVRRGEAPVASDYEPTEAATQTAPPPPAERWRFNAQDTVSGTLVIVDRVLYLCAHGTLSALDIATGTAIWQLDLYQTSCKQLAVVDGTVYVSA